MNKKLIIGLSVGTGAAVLLMIAAMAFLIWHNTTEAGKYASEFADCLKEGRLEELQTRYYMSEGDLLRAKEEGPSVTIVTRQKIAQRYGADWLIEEDQEETSQEKLLRLLMQHSELKTSVGIVPAGSARMSVTLTGPDLESWAGQLTEVEKSDLRWNEETLYSRVEAALESGDIAPRTVSLRVLMQRRAGKWYFAKSEELEDALFGGLYQALAGSVSQDSQTQEPQTPES